jgi:D-alanyl-D-alanine dipeptidase
VLVRAGGWDDTTAWLRRYERPTTGSAWRALPDSIPVVLGRAGLAWGVGQGSIPAEGAVPKREGDGRSPAGAYPLLHGFGYAYDVAGLGDQLAWAPVEPGTVCVDDPASPLYNTMADARRASGARWTSAERMRDVAGYRLGVVVGYNGARTAAGPVRRTAPGPRAVAGRGSCIFLHLWDGPARPTAGCTAMSESGLAAVAGWLDVRRRPVLVQLPRAEYARRRAAWALP